MKLIYQIEQLNQTRENVFYTRLFQLYKATDKEFVIHIVVKDLFDCEIKNKTYPVTYSARHQRYLERGIRKNKLEPIENFSTEDHPLYEFRW
jgi:hypothetical protein